MNLLKPINHFTKNPKQLLLIDVVGALVTSILLLFIVDNFNQLFGIDSSNIKILAIIALLIFCYGFIGLFSIKKYWKSFLLVLASINLCYCIITILLLLLSPSITILGILYFSIELIIIVFLAYVEIKTAIQIN